MEEGTAGIGEAGALINKAKAPTGMDITRGIQMAQSHALKKAQLEAAAAAKADAAAAAMNKYRTIKTGMYKDESVNKEAQQEGIRLQNEMNIAAKNRDYVRMNELAQQSEFLHANLAVKDKFLVSLAPDDTKVDTSGMLVAARKGELPQYLQTQSPLIQKSKYFRPDAEGNIILNRPDKFNFDKAYDEVVSKLDPDYIDMKAAAFNKIKMTKRVPPEILHQRAQAFVEQNEAASNALDWSTDFQKYYKEQYKNNPDREIEAKVNFVYNNLTKYNEPRYQIGTKPKENSTFTIGGSGFGIGNYNFSVVPKTTAEAAAEFEDSRIMYGRSAVVSQAFIDGFKQQGETPITEVVMPENATGTFIVNDPNMGKGIRKGKPVSLLEANGKAYLIYRDSERNSGQIVEMTPTIVSQMATYYKTTPENFIDAYHSQNIDLSGYAPKGNIGVQKNDGSKGGSNAGGSAPTITSAQYRAMSVPERTAFKQKKGIIKG